MSPEPFAIEKSDAEWRRELSPAAYAVLRAQGTEHPGSSPLNEEHRSGTFRCGACAQALFSSATKFDSGSGWPSFFQPLAGAVGTEEDHSLFTLRTEVHCARCGSHLGHRFADDPAPSAERYCMNGVALRFEPAAG